MEGAPGLVDVLRRKINGKKHSESYFSLGTSLLCWNVSASKQSKDPSREVQHSWEFPLPSMGKFITLALLLVAVWWFQRVECPQLGRGQCLLACPPWAKLMKKKKKGKKIPQRSCVGFWTLKMDNLSFCEEGREGKVVRWAALVLQGSAASGFKPAH